MKRFDKPLHEWTDHDVVEYIGTHARFYENLPPKRVDTYAVPDPRSPDRNLFSEDTGELADMIRGFIETAKNEFASHLEASTDAAGE